jgi:hypothetical protein
MILQNKELILYIVKPYRLYNRNPNGAEGKERATKAIQHRSSGTGCNVTVSLNKIEGVNGGRAEYEAQDVLVRAFISAEFTATGS